MFLVDTSVWIGIFRDRTGLARASFQTLIGDEIIYLSRFTQMELLQGSRDDREWKHNRLLYRSSCNRLSINASS
jgi:predicted nucleic acid-binding protein